MTESPAWKVNDVIHFNSDSEDDENHNHWGRILKINKVRQQVTIRLHSNDMICSYFIKDVRLKVQ